MRAVAENERNKKKLGKILLLAAALFLLLSSDATLPPVVITILPEYGVVFSASFSNWGGFHAPSRSCLRLFFVFCLFSAAGSIRSAERHAPASAFRKIKMGANGGEKMNRLFSQSAKGEAKGQGMAA